MNEMRERECKQNERLQEKNQKKEREHTHTIECHHFLSKAFNRRNARLKAEKEVNSMRNLFSGEKPFQHNDNKLENSSVIGKHLGWQLGCSRFQKAKRKMCDKEE